VRPALRCMLGFAPSKFSLRRRKDRLLLESRFFLRLRWTLPLRLATPLALFVCGTLSCETFAGQGECGSLARRSFWA